jgi:hypothetical protein
VPNNAFDIPVTASDGIQEIEVTEEPMRTMTSSGLAVPGSRYAGRRELDMVCSGLPEWCLHPSGE